MSLPPSADDVFAGSTFEGLLETNVGDDVVWPGCCCVDVVIVVPLVVVAVVDAVAAFVQRPQQLFLWIFGNLLGREWLTRTPRSASGVLAIF